LVEKNLHFNRNRFDLDIIVRSSARVFVATKTSLSFEIIDVSKSLTYVEAN